VSLADLTEPDAVRAAIREFDAIGRDAFLEKYGFGPAREYFLEFDGELYDSKAIVGAAHGYQYPDRGPLRSADFSGGEATVQAKLHSVGFRVVTTTRDPEPAEARASWSPEEVAATVSEYFLMLELELRGERYNKKEHNRRLQRLLRNRSAGAIEFKHANISAVLIELGFPYIDGYKPRGNYQEMLKTEVEARLERSLALSAVAANVVAAPVTEAATMTHPLDDVFVPAPPRTAARPRTYEQLVTAPRKGVDYLEIEARNRSLGLAGELFVLDAEHRRLWTSGRRVLAERIEHVSKTKGDGLGFDIASYEADGRERLIEVKTTRFGQMTPFYASRTEVAVSDERSAAFSLYRVFKFREAPKVFVLSGSLRESCLLDPVQFRASFR
jgi:hypothetical protein